MLEQKEIKVAGKKYLLQNPGYRWYLKQVDKHQLPNGNPSQEKMYDAYLEYVVVEPKGLDIDDFEERGGIKALVELMNKCEAFLTSE